MMNYQIRRVKSHDLPDLKAVLDATELFPSSMLDAMIADFLNNPDSTDIWFTTVLDNQPISIGYCAPERMTEGTFNLYAIAVNPGYQGKGLGKAMMEFIEDLLRKAGHRILLVETSGTADFELTRSFYRKCNYTEEAKIRDFYTEGDDKVVFWKKLTR